MINPSNLTTFYVSQKYGNDEFTGFFEEVRDDMQGPLKTIERALKKVSEMRLFGYLQPVSIVITDDIYFLEKPVIIDETVSAVTITSYNNSIISGGRKIENFKNDTYNGYKCFSADVDGIDEGFWFTDLYVDNKRADFTRYPQEGTLKAQDVENKSTVLFASSKWFIATKEDTQILKTFKNFGDCFISYNHYWVDEHTPIESYDLEERKIVFKYPSRFTIELTHPESALNYIIENVAECFENKNEWYLDRQTKKVYYIPRNDEQTADSITAYAPVTDKLFVVKGKKGNKVKNIRFENLVFANTKGDYKSIYTKSQTDDGQYYIDENNPEGFASDIQSVCWAHGTIEFYYAHSCYIEKCVLKNIGVHAITVNEGCDRININDNDMFDLGAGAIKITGGLAGCDKEDETYGNVVKNNIITDSGNRYFAACGVLIMHSYENTVANNDISYQYYTGISVGWVWGYIDSITRDNLIEKNHIHHIGQGKLSDMGGIYLLGKQPGTIVRNNVVHDVTSAHYGGWGLYTDEGSSYITLENNICYNLTCNGMHQHFGNMNTVRNNIFAKMGDEPVRVSKEELHKQILLERNIFVSEGKPIYRVGSEDHPSGGVYAIGANKNILFDTKKGVAVLTLKDKEYTLKEAQEAYGIEDNSIVADPCFVDFENNDFTLKENSPAFKLGFKQIDIKDVGAKR